MKNIFKIVINGIENRLFASKILKISLRSKENNLRLSLPKLNFEHTFLIFFWQKSKLFFSPLDILPSFCRDSSSWSSCPHFVFELASCLTQASQSEM